MVAVLYLSSPVSQNLKFHKYNFFVIVYWAQLVRGSECFGFKPRSTNDSVCTFTTTRLIQYNERDKLVWRKPRFIYKTILYILFNVIPLIIYAFDPAGCKLFYTSCKEILSWRLSQFPKILLSSTLFWNSFLRNASFSGPNKWKYKVRNQGS